MAKKQRNEIEDELSLLIESSDDESNSERSATDEEMEDMSEDENVAEGDVCEVDWTDEVKNNLLTPDEEIVFDSGPVHDLPPGSTPLQFLKLFLPDDICEAFQLNINKYAELEQKRKNLTDAQWKPVENILELWRFFSIILICGIVRVPKLKDYWSSNDILGNQAVKRLMSGNRFRKILHYFHIADGDNEELEYDETFNFAQTVDPIMDDIKERFIKHFRPPRELLVNETFIKNKVSMEIQHYLPFGPTRNGLKIWTVSSPAGYVFNFDLHSRKRVNVGRTKNGLGYDVVNRLLLPIESKGHHLYLDKLFTSVPLMMDLHKNGNRACGSVRIDRKYMPKELKTLNLTKFGAYRYFQCIQCPDLLCCVWCDFEQHCVLSTNSKKELVEVKMRQGCHVRDMKCPSIIHKYNTHMGYMGKPQQNRSMSLINRFSSKWWRYMFWFLFDSCLNNAFIVYSSTNMPSNRNSKKLLDFKLDVIEEILNCAVSNSLRNRGLNFRSSTSETSSKSDSNPAAPSVFLHRKVRINGRKQTCKRCSKLKRKTAKNHYVQSSYMCNVCQICLCVACFGAFHSENQMEFS